MVLDMHTFELALGVVALGIMFVICCALAKTTIFSQDVEQNKKDNKLAFALFVCVVVILGLLLYI